MSRPRLSAAIAAFLLFIVPARAAAAKQGFSWSPTFTSFLVFVVGPESAPRAMAGKAPQLPPPAFGADPPYYVKAGSWQETVRLSREAPASGPWEPQGKVFFLRHGKPGIDVGWVGYVGSRVAGGPASR